MTLPNETVLDLLKKDFVVGWKNIKNEYYAGQSHGYSRSQSSVGTTNGAGPHNVQIFVLSPELVVLHALPGFWHPDDLARELRFAKVLFRLWRDDTRTQAEKERMFSRLQLAEARNQPPATRARSAWQPFDVHYELSRLRSGARDTVILGYDGKPRRGANSRIAMKPINQLVHERMAKRPFRAFDDFDVAAFIDYGRPYYDNNAGVDGRGKKFYSWWRTKRKPKKRKSARP